MKTIDSKTFGDFKASKVIAAILEEHNNEKYSTKIGRFYASYCRSLKDYLNLKDKKTYTISIMMLYQYYRNQANHFDIPTPLKSHLLNLISARYKQSLIKEING
jgi:flagellum-specific peptidoglycan hydrolase FlgJ